MSIRRKAIAAVMMSSLVGWSDFGWATDDDALLKMKVLKVYPDALKELETHFSKAFGSGSGSEEHGIGTKMARRIDGQFTFAAKGPFLAKVARKATSTTMKEKKRTAPGPIETVFCYNKTNSFSLKKDAGSSEYQIKAFDENKDGELPLKQQMVAWVYKYLEAPFRLRLMRMSAAVAHPDFSIQHVSEVHEGNKTFLKIEFDFKKSLQNCAGWITVAPDEKWVLHDYEYSDIQDFFRGHIDYGEPQGGFPVPKRVVITRMNPAERRPTSVVTFDFENLKFGDVPDSDFTLAAFGFPGVEDRVFGGHSSTERRHWSGTGWLFAGIGFVLLIAAFLLKYASSRFRKKA